MTTIRPVLVTGGAGFIGSHTCKALAQAGFLPVAFDNLSTGHRSSVKWGPLVEADIADEAAVAATIASYHPVALIHFAANAYVGESTENPAKYYRNNVVGTQHLLDACRQSGLRHIVFSSSCATYGIPDVVPIPETAPQQPVNPYGRTKLMCEQMILDYAAAFDVKPVILRYFNAAGADPDGEIGERHDPETHLIPLAIRAATGAGAPLNVFGTDYDTEDGTCIRDYIHVTDLATAHVAAVRHLMRDGAGEIVNIGTGRGVSVRQVIDAVEACTGKPVHHVLGPRRAGDPPELVANADKAARLFDFAPRHSDLTTIVRTAAAFLAETTTTPGDAEPQRKAVAYG